MSGFLATRVEEDGNRATVTATELATGEYRRFTADRIFLACGGIGTARLAMGSLGLFDRKTQVQESRQFVVPFLSRPTPTDPRVSDDFTLNQFNMAVSLDSVDLEISQLHFYPYNPAFSDALPRALKSPRAEAVRSQLFRRLSVALGYLPSWRAPGFAMTVHRPASQNALPPMTLEAVRSSFLTNSMLRAIVQRLLAAAPALDLWPLIPMLRVTAPGKSYHWGGVFPHRAGASESTFSSDSLGRVRPWRRVHLVDASVFPSIPATTFTLTVMANAHRIAASSIREP